MANAQMSKTTHKQQDVEMDESDRPSHDARTKLRIIEVDRSLELHSIAWNEKRACKHNFKRSKDMHNKLRAMEEEKLREEAESVREMEIQQKLYTDYMQEIQQRDEEYECQLQREQVKLMANTQMEMATLVQ
ncbi:hypothetical protein BU17DRAFT_60265 [Hysterangium stoloniferum]|nr:hypothetical protein BU17DRAFT_60265 [Hysterangium stoloniferum]